MATITERLTKIIAEQLEIEEESISSDLQQNFTEDLKADSLNLVEIVTALEDEFDLAIPDDVAEKIKTPQQALDFLLKNVKS